MPHPEGGFYRETFRSPLLLSLPDGRERSASTAIYYLLPPGTFSAWHRVASDEVWHHYAGGPLRLYLLGHGECRLDS
ncbi:MAG TPA: cupin domain-containing protein, partial [Gemmatimonadales bacterium]|nr:cupin domain-containing protein [Gemmatimonadales bacterium]